MKTRFLSILASAIDVKLISRNFSSGPMIVLLAVTTIVSAGCENAIEPTAEATAIDWTEIQETPEYQQLEAVRTGVFNLLMTQDVSKKDLERAYTANDVNVVADILGQTPQELTKLVDAFHESMAYFQEKYPEIRPGNESLEGQCTPADIESVLADYDNLKSNYANYEVNKAFKTSAGPPSCRMAPYAACLVLAGYAAAAVSPTGIGSIIVLGAGAVICVCEYCSGGFLNWIC